MPDFPKNPTVAPVPAPVEAEKLLKITLKRDIQRSKKESGSFAALLGVEADGANFMWHVSNEYDYIDEEAVEQLDAAMMKMFAELEIEGEFDNKGQIVIDDATYDDLLAIQVGLVDMQEDLLDMGDRHAAKKGRKAKKAKAKRGKRFEKMADKTCECCGRPFRGKKEK